MPYVVRNVLVLSAATPVHLSGSMNSQGDLRTPKLKKKPVLDVNKNTRSGNTPI